MIHDFVYMFSFYEFSDQSFPGTIENVPFSEWIVIDPEQLIINTIIKFPCYAFLFIRLAFVFISANRNRSRKISLIYHTLQVTFSGYRSLGVSGCVCVCVFV